ncbi:MAG: low-specificity L-threonine aldolase [Chloroflexota bacterium]
MTDFIDLRSDTVTQPTPAMREAMAVARVGDDVYREDPLVNELEAMSAELTGKEAGLFVPSGTMGNLAAVLAHCGRGDEVILGNKAHTFLYEAGGISVLGGIHSHQLPNQADGSLEIEAIRAAIRPDDVHAPITRLICLENTHNRCGGTYQTPAYTRLVSEFAHQSGLFIHLDGARVFNAAVAQGVNVKEITKHVDSVTFCLSKGLCAPVGSILCGSNETIARGRRMRKILGGGMRQAGILAAAGIVALETMIDRLAEDHARAKRLADGLNEIEGISLDPETPATNMIFLTISAGLTWTATEFATRLKERGILVGPTGERQIRMVAHYWIDDRAIEYTLVAIRDLVGKPG